eukprot:TRINITY_DN4617_c0_g1_i5.p1 TRINITY_DN4617_c0_g1~~TRINITY_DN4617_c0_g1_i5.p1  ORF type:complete len:248 (-),score=34.16 TRINITY_DN4617_c0_g1_i5:91-834(-)
MPSSPVPLFDKSSGAVESGASASDGFLGPFQGMGISGYNDLGSFNVNDPSKCAELCRKTSGCNSFDYGARGSVLGECWLSTATRASAGSAYTEWQQYDYYEVKGSSILETAAAAGKFTVLAKALTAAGLVETLAGAGPFTVFAPTDDAFGPFDLDELLARDDLATILTFHVTNGFVLSSSLSNGMQVPMLDGSKVTVSLSGGGVKIGSASVETADLQCNNGVIHVIDKVLLPSVDKSSGAVESGASA